jgi:septum formation protein
MFLEKIKNYHLILATQSPRRHFLMKEAGFEFETIIPEGIEEKYPETLKKEEIPIYLAELKASFFDGKLKKNDILITADTIVYLDNNVLGKPVDRADAIDMLTKLSGRSHDVYTGVCFLSSNKKHSFSAISTVYFRVFSENEIHYYVDKYKPFDKAGAYGAQEWIGYVGIEHIEGSYFNVMGLPIQKLYEELEKFIE